MPHRVIHQKPGNVGLQDYKKTHVAFFFLCLLSIILTSVFTGVQAYAAEQKEPVVVPADKEKCLDCHTAKRKLKMDTVGKEKPSTYLSPELILETAHANLSCVDCHKGYKTAVERRNVSRFGKSAVKVLHSEEEYRNYTQVATEACGDSDCHEKEQKDFLAGSHSLLVVKTDRDLPTCTTCHNFHYIPRLFKDKNGKPMKISAELKVEIAVSLCGSCHINELNTYTGNYHFKALRLGSPDAPMCYDCHGGHISTPLKSGTKDAVASCKKCHEHASIDFTRYVVHLNPVSLTAPAEVLYSNAFYSILVALVLVVATLHTLIQGSRKRTERRIKERKEIERLRNQQDH